MAMIEKFLVIAFFPVMVMSGTCSIPGYSIVYNIGDSKHSDVGTASYTWMKNFLTWWQSQDPSIKFIGRSPTQIQTDDYVDCPSLRLFIQPGGNTYSSLSNLGTKGAATIKNFVNRPQTNPSSYAGFCAGGYMAAYDYIWETFYEGPSYFQSYNVPAPLGFMPHTVEGSLFDIGDDQFGSYDTKTRYRMVNISNGHQMVYYGGSTVGYNGVPGYADPSSPQYDPKMKPLIYFTDFYGFNSVNIPAAWLYTSNILMTSVHPEADSSVCVDCLATGTIPSAVSTRNWQWLCHYLNQITQSSFNCPMTSSPVFNTTAPHNTYPKLPCYSTVPSPSNILFCDDFNVAKGSVYPGLAMQWQRNMTTWNSAQP